VVWTALFFRMPKTRPKKFGRPGERRKDLRTTPPRAPPVSRLSVRTNRATMARLFDCFQHGVRHFGSGWLAGNRCRTLLKRGNLVLCSASFSAARISHVGRQRSKEGSPISETQKMLEDHLCPLQVVDSTEHRVIVDPIVIEKQEIVRTTHRKPELFSAQQIRSSGSSPFRPSSRQRLDVARQCRIGTKHRTRIQQRHPTLQNRLSGPAAHSDVISPITL